MWRQRGETDQTDRIAAFAQATERYAEGLDDPDLANVYWGKSLGLWQAVMILAAVDGNRPGSPRGRAPGCGRRGVAPEAAKSSAGG